MLLGKGKQIALQLLLPFGSAFIKTVRKYGSEESFVRCLLEELSDDLKVFFFLLVFQQEGLNVAVEVKLQLVGVGPVKLCENVGEFESEWGLLNHR